MIYHFWELKQILEEFKTDFIGLSKEEVQKRLSKYGKNSLPEEKVSLFNIFLKQFKNIFNLVLFFVLILTLYLSKFTDSFVIILIILANAFIGFFFELRTEKTLEKLKQLLKPKAKVLRDKELFEINSENLVPGDIIFIEEGDIIPADLRFFEIENLKVDESILTGESLPVEKDIKILPEETSIPEMKNIGFMGSYVIEGKGRGIVIATGIKTYIGSIYEKFRKIEQFAPHFEKLSKDLILKMIVIAISTSILIFYFAFQRNYFLSDSLLFVLSSFVSSIPEGLPVIITVLLVISAYALYKKNILVKNIQATENLSVINLLLSDKTGTLTENVMTIRKIFVTSEEIEITGEGHNLEGKFLKDGKEINILENYPLVKLLNICAIVSEGSIIKNGDLKVKGNPRDIALLILLEKSGFKREEILEKEKIKKRESFSRIKKHKRVIVEHERIESYYLGAFEKIINYCNYILTYEGVREFKNKEEILNKAIEYANNGFSILAAAYNEGEKEENLIFVGLIALYDPPKKGVKETIQKLKSAGIDIRILTGDHKATAVYIAKEIGFENINAVDEDEIRNLPEEKLKEILKNIYIFARITPETKLKILELYQKLGYSVSYIGDGVNDVLSLKKAEVGVCMGKRGSEIAKSASDIILIDDNLESLLSGFIEGRKIFNNLKRVVFFLITTNVAESLTILTALILGFPFILKPTHILFLNFVTDTLIGTTLAFEKEHGNELQSKPRNPKESLISLDLLPFLLMMASIMMILTVLIFSIEYLFDLDKARTYAFLVMSLTQLYNALNLRSLNKTIFRLNFKLNPYIIVGIVLSLFLQYFVIFNPIARSILGFSQITLFEFFIILLLSSIVLVVGELYKFIKQKFIKINK
ncbi:MAG: haloacid dehalogenase [Candidatus Parcubacteria bacterium]|nr:MAG: haloacid dehalogenase [Candidatus Parcubacteria bacterium]